jgi:hypothetical protein
MSPLILSFPCINAAVGFSFPVNIATKLSLSRENITSAVVEGSPWPAPP